MAPPHEIDASNQVSAFHLLSSSSAFHLLLTNENWWDPALKKLNPWDPAAARFEPSTSRSNTWWIRPQYKHTITTVCYETKVSICLQYYQRYVNSSFSVILKFIRCPAGYQDLLVIQILYHIGVGYSDPPPHNCWLFIFVRYSDPSYLCRSWTKMATWKTRMVAYTLTACILLLHPLRRWHSTTRGRVW